MYVVISEEPISKPEWISVDRNIFNFQFSIICHLTYLLDINPPPRGVHSLARRWFHLHLIHTNLDERFGKIWIAQRAYWELVSRGNNFFAKKRTLGNRLISCSLMTAFGQKRT